MTTIEPGTPEPVPATPQPEDATSGITRASAAWVATGGALVLLLLLIVFILQNQTKVRIKLLWLDGSVALGVAMLIAAVAGGCLVAVAGVARIMQLRHIVRRTEGRLPSAHRS